LKLRAERKLGVLIEQSKPRESRPRSHDGTLAKGRTLPAGISKSESHRYQQIAKLPEKVFEQQMAKAKSENDAPTTAGILRVARRAERTQTVTEIRESNGPKTVDSLEKLVKGGAKFGTIYADPPWRYGNTVTRAAADGQYPTMSLEEIAALPIGKLAADESHLHLLLEFFSYFLRQRNNFLCKR
jgi:hypothetical protein